MKSKLNAYKTLQKYKEELTTCTDNLRRLQLQSLIGMYEDITTDGRPFFEGYKQFYKQVKETEE